VERAGFFRLVGPLLSWPPVFPCDEILLVRKTRGSGQQAYSGPRNLAVFSLSFDSGGPAKSCSVNCPPLFLKALQFSFQALHSDFSAGLIPGPLDSF